MHSSRQRRARLPQVRGNLRKREETASRRSERATLDVYKTGEINVAFLGDDPRYYLCYYGIMRCIIVCYFLTCTHTYVERRVEVLYYMHHVLIDPSMTPYTLQRQSARVMEEALFRKRIPKELDDLTL